MDTSTPVDQGEALYKFGPIGSNAPDGFIYTAEAKTLSSLPYLRIVASDGEELIIPPKFYDELSGGYSAIKSKLGSTICEAQRDILFTNFPEFATDFRKEVAWLVGDNPKVDGTPYLVWTRILPSQDSQWKGEFGWELFLFGSISSLGFASWHDLEAIKGLKDSMKNRNNLIITSSLIDPVETRKLTAKLCLKDLANIYTVKLHPIRKALKEIGLINQNQLSASSPTLQGGYLTRFSIPLSGAKKEAFIAICIMSPRKPINMRPVGDQRNSVENYEARALQARREWNERAKEKIKDIGWNIVELVQPGYAWEGLSVDNWIWATPYTTEDWAKIEILAKAEAHNLRPTDGSRF
jgi:hypothetical protein